MWKQPARIALFDSRSIRRTGGRAGARRRQPAEQPNPQAAEARPTARREAAPLPVPPPVPPLKLDPVLPTTPVRRGQQSPNVQMVDASLLPRDKEGIWVLDFAFKPVRLRTVEVPGRGRRQIHYLYYRVVNRTGKPRVFVPQFSLVTDTGKRYEDVVMPQAVQLIQAREDPTIPLLGAVNIMGMIPPSTKEGVDDAVFGVAIWEGVDPKADAFNVYVRGLSDGQHAGPRPRWRQADGQVQDVADRLHPPWRRTEPQRERDRAPRSPLRVDLLVSRGGLPRPDPSRGPGAQLGAVPVVGFA